MGENIHQQRGGQFQTTKRRTKVHTAEALALKLLYGIVYDKCCRIGGRLELDDLIETTGIGDWKMSDFELARAYAVSQGWLAIKGNSLTLTTAGLASA